ncbi:MAG: prolipoprotein diacylglyceryl transferase [Kiritimatiellae bacterium]|nr:prolipoprotein diacylglyceryl transferase [Kiritimatiellia bacterium]
MHPDLINIGPLHLKTYGACLAAGFLICSFLVEKISKRRDISALLVSLMLCGVIGARIAYVIEYWDRQFAGNFWNIFRVDQGGLVFYGGLLLSIIWYIGWCIVKKAKVTELSDILCAVIPLGHAFGRIGCYFYGCCYGRLVDNAFKLKHPFISQFSVKFPFNSPAWNEQFVNGLIPASAKKSLAVLPTQLFESLALFVLFAILMILTFKTSESRKAGRHGLVTGVYLVGYSLIRFALEYLRGDPRAAVGPFSIAQTISFGMFSLGAFFIIRFALFKAPKSN